MAKQERAHGDTKPVFAIDTLAGPVTGTGAAGAGIPVQIAGPKLEFFGIDLGSDPSGQADTGGAIEAVIRCITQLATVHFYQYQASASANNFSVAVYPVGAWGTSGDGTAGYNIQTAIRALGTVNSYDLSGAAVTGAASSSTAGDGSNLGFKLALS